MTKTYVGTKIVTAWPQAKNDPISGVPHATLEGYAVKYEDGYTSWSPKDTFEASYRELHHTSGLLPHQIVVAGDWVQLLAQHETLLTFLASEAYSELDPEVRAMYQLKSNAQTELLVQLKREMYMYCVEASLAASGSGAPSNQLSAELKSELARTIQQSNDEALERHHTAYDKLVKEQYPETKMAMADVVRHRPPAENMFRLGQIGLYADAAGKRVWRYQHPQCENLVILIGFGDLPGDRMVPLLCQRSEFYQQYTPVEIPSDYWTHNESGVAKPFLQIIEPPTPTESEDEDSRAQVIDEFFKWDIFKKAGVDLVTYMLFSQQDRVLICAALGRAHVR